MELFYARETAGGLCRLDAEESAHCVKVLRHRRGDAVEVIDGTGTLLHCRLVDDDPREAVAEVLAREEGWGARPYRLCLAVCPTKHNDRYEWFVEKAVEIGVDEIVPLIGERSERKVYKTDRARKIALAAAKQSLKAALPLIAEPVSVRSFLRARPAGDGALGLIACCFEDGTPRAPITAALAAADATDITVLIGPEGDFSPEEAALARTCGYRPVHLGSSRLRTETAGVFAAQAVYARFLLP